MSSVDGQTIMQNVLAATGAMPQGMANTYTPQIFGTEAIHATYDPRTGGVVSASGIQFNAQPVVSSTIFEQPWDDAYGFHKQHEEGDLLWNFVGPRPMTTRRDFQQDVVVNYP